MHEGRYPDEVVNEAINRLNEGKHPKDVTDELREEYGYERLHPKTVASWGRKYPLGKSPKTLPRKAELEASVAAQKDMEAQAAAVPVKVRSFMEDFRDMEVPQAKAVLQSIIKAAHVFKDGRIELEFRP